jgi:hypothetical protein
LTVQGQIKRVEVELNRLGQEDTRVVLLRTIPGVGIRTAEAVVAYLDDVKRFASIKKAASYFGLVPSQDASAAVNRLGRITRQGPSLVRRLLTEAAWQGIRRSPQLRTYFERIGQGNAERNKIALVATAHHLVRVMVAMLRSGEIWREPATQGVAGGVSWGTAREALPAMRFADIVSATRGTHCRPLDPRLASLCCREGKIVRRRRSLPLGRKREPQPDPDEHTWCLRTPRV